MRSGRAGHVRARAEERRRAGPVTRRFPIALGVTGVVAGFIALDFAFGGSHGAPIGAYTTNGAYSFVSAPALHPPVIQTDIKPASSKLAPGYILMANFYDLNYPPMVGQSGPMILDNSLQPVWFRPVPKNVVAGNLSLQTYNGKPALAWWQGVVTNTGATEQGEDVVVNQHYQTVATLKATDGWVLTLHEIAIRGDDAWVTANKNLPMDLSKYGGAYNGALIDSAVQEYNLKTGKLALSWDALKHIPLSDSQATLPTNGFPWDAYHVNSIDVPGDGTFVVSMRNTWAAYKVDITTGEDHLDARRAALELQVRAGRGLPVAARRGGVSGLAADDDVRRPLLPDHRRRHVRLADRARRAGSCSSSTRRRTRPRSPASTSHGSSFDSEYMGSLQPLAGGNEFVGWGSAPYLTEYSARATCCSTPASPDPTSPTAPRSSRGSACR